MPAISPTPIATTAPIFAGGLVRAWVERQTSKVEESELSAGTLFSSGLIAGGSLAGILFAILVGAAGTMLAEQRRARLLDAFIDMGVLPPSVLAEITLADGWLSTHPAGKTRIEEIERHLPQVLPLYRQTSKG